MRRSDALALVVTPHERPALAAARRQRGPGADFVSSSLGLDADAIERALERMRERHPGQSDLELARRCVIKAAWRAGGASLLLGLPDHPALAIPAAAVEAVVVRRIRLVAVAQIAMLHEAHALRAGQDPIAALTDLAARHATGDAVNALCSRAGKKARKAAIRRIVKVDAAHVVGALCKGVGLEACGRTVLKLIPVLGAVAGAAVTASAVRAGARARLSSPGAAARAPRGRRRCSRVSGAEHALETRREARRGRDRRSGHPDGRRARCRHDEVARSDLDVAGRGAHPGASRGGRGIPARRGVTRSLSPVGFDAVPGGRLRPWPWPPSAPAWHEHGIEPRR